MHDGSDERQPLQRLNHQLINRGALRPRAATVSVATALRQPCIRRWLVTDMLPVDTAVTPLRDDGRATTQAADAAGLMKLTWPRQPAACLARTTSVYNVRTVRDLAFDACTAREPADDRRRRRPIASLWNSVHPDTFLSSERPSSEQVRSSSSRLHVLSGVGGFRAGHSLPRVARERRRGGGPSVHPATSISPPIWRLRGPTSSRR